MTELISRLEVAVPLGVVGATILILLARRLSLRRERTVYGVALFLAAIAYLLFGLRTGAPVGHLATEGVGALVFTVAAVVGARRWPMILAFGWVAHVAWDLFLHHADGPGFAPSWYPSLCVGFDLLLGGYIAGTVSRDSDPSLDRRP